MKEEEAKLGWPAEAIQLLSYLSRYPESADTLEGIAEWWILRESVERRVTETARALDFLVSRSLVIEEWTAEDQPRYRLNLKRLEEISELVREMERR